MIRERSIQNWTYNAGQQQTLDLPRDATFHILQLEGSGYVTNVQGASGQGVVFDDCFPFSILKNIRLIRNGSDVVFQGSGCLLAKEHYYLNERWPHARLYRYSAANVESLLLSSAALALGGKGVTIPANAEGIGCTQVQFATATSASSTTIVNFDFQVDLYLQMGPEDCYFGTLVDARRLATFQLELTYAAVSDLMYSAAESGQVTNTVTCTGSVMSYDQDNLAVDSKYGTFKRSQLSYQNIPYSSSNQQFLLPRGNYFHGIIMETLAQKAGSTTILCHENAVLLNIQNRINSNFQLRNFDFDTIQRKNQADGCVNSAYSGSRGGPNGSAFLYYPVTGDKGFELVPTHVMDQFDLLISTVANATIAANAANPSQSGPENGATTTGTNPTINLLLQEVIPGVSIGEQYPTAAMAGSKRGTSAKPYAR